MGIRKLPGAETSTIHEVFCLREPISLEPVLQATNSLPPPHALCEVSFTLLKGTLLISLCAYSCPLPFAVQLWQPFTPLVLSGSGFLVLSDKRQDSFSPLPLQQDCPSLPPNSFCLHLFFLEPAGKIRQNCSDKVYSYLGPFLRGRAQASHGQITNGSF